MYALIDPNVEASPLICKFIEYRYVVDYDFYRHKRKTLEEECKKDSANSHKLADRIKDCDSKRTTRPKF
jgi:hypothetical protein